MNITDIPLSGVYYQKGAITEIVVQFLDFSTGLPVQLQVATGLMIAIEYPDGSTTQIFNATLFSDGSDGMIVYTTRNDGMGVIDLSQVGLYHVQGYAAIGSAQLPPTSESDFYVLPNIVQEGQPSGGFSASAIIFFDSNNTRWALTVDGSGGLHFVATPTGPATFLYLSRVVMQDSNGVYWTIVKNTDSSYTATPGGSFTQALQSFILNDVNGKGWIVTISTSGVLVAA